MSQIEGWYYLHVNGELIYKRELGETAADIRESDLCRGMWPFVSSDREMAYTIVIEGLAGGAKESRVDELIKLWELTDEDTLEYASRVGCILGVDGNNKTAMRKDFVNLQESVVGFGDNNVKAMAKLCSNLGYKPSKMWGATFKDLLK